MIRQYAMSQGATEAEIDKILGKIETEEAKENDESKNINVKTSYKVDGLFPTFVDIELTDSKSVYQNSPPS